MEYIVQFLNQISAGIEAVFCVADFVLFCFVVLSAAGVVISYIYTILLTNDRLTSNKDTTSNRSLSGNEQTSEIKEQITTGTRTENNNKIVQSGDDKDFSRNSVVLLQHNNRVEKLGTLVEYNSNEDLSLMNARKSMDLLDIYTSLKDSSCNDATSGDANSALQSVSNEEEDLYCSVDDIKERCLSSSDSGSGIRNDLILHHQVKRNMTKMEVENAINLKNDNYHQLRKTVCQALVKGKQLPSWIMTEEASQIPKKLSQEGYGWINQWCLEQKLCGNSIEQLEICLETLQKKWTLICSIQSETGRANECKNLVEDQVTEQKIYEAIKFLMLYKAIHLHNTMENGRTVPEFCKYLFARSTSLYPYYLMINHLNLIGHTRSFEETETELLKYTLEIATSDSFVLE
ncbi:ubiquitin thioesterase otulin-like [Pristis pectinata]|uniref:ubiquitin thioesterase otulin-like n=1 Tax=Pristis pectinata TaxID=685728 RepID=UPI00223DB7A0|nr:ubiquitin thioesterase otulin-like [Pristis pectinata]XP_051871724.1 ubiquitin thioesterase otulin-like [Pristis pectinata]XP_051871726.1 ubiquitin thioesterase otulin-like [Pristis pectinata]